MDTKAVIRSFYEDVYSKHDINMLDSILSYTWIGHDPSITGGTSHYDDHKAQAAELSGAFPDLHASIDDLMMDGDKISVRVTLKGTHKGAEIRGVRATGKKMNITGIAIHRVSGGKVAESWMVWDFLGLMTQLGAVRK